MVESVVGQARPAPVPMPHQPFAGRRAGGSWLQRTSELQRLAKVLEDSGIKIDSVASALTTLSARDMIEALINGQRDPGMLAELARGRMRSKIPDLRLACAGRFADQHALMCTLHLEHIDHLTDMIARLDTRIDEASFPFAHQIELLATIPGDQ